MKKLKKFLFPCEIAVVLLLSACQPSAPPIAPETDGSASLPAAETASRYSCADGSVVEATYPTTDTARILYKGQSIEMKLVISASGARYTGGGWQWWTKGLTEGSLAPLAPDEDIASSSSTICTAETGDGK